MKQLKHHLSPANRRRLAHKLRAARRFDRDKSGTGKLWRRNRSLTGYSEAMRTDLAGKISNIIKKRGSCRMLDVGCGDCHALAEAKHKFENKVRTHGLRLYGRREHRHFSDELVQSFTDRIHVGSIENYVFKEKYDMIVSFAGIHYTVNAPLAIQKVANALSVGGEAHLQLKKARIPKELVERLENQGFAVKISSRRGLTTVLHMSRLTRRRADLSNIITKEAKKKINPRINVKERLDER